MIWELGKGSEVLLKGFGIFRFGISESGIFISNAFYFEQWKYDLLQVNQ